MKIREMNAHQKFVYMLMDKWTTEMIGGCENTLMDYAEDSDEYKTAYNYLHQEHKDLAKNIYDLVMSDCMKGSYASHARFAGSDFLKERIEVRLKKWEY